MTIERTDTKNEKIMEDKKRNDDKVSTGGLKGLAEISVNIALFLCALYMGYSFFYKDSFIENLILKALTTAETLRATCPTEDSLNSLPKKKIKNSHYTLLGWQLKNL